MTPFEMGFYNLLSDKVGQKFLCGQLQIERWGKIRVILLGFVAGFRKKGILVSMIALGKRKSVFCGLP